MLRTWILPLIVLASLPSCSLARDTSPFSEKQLWRVSGTDRLRPVSAEVGTGWLGISSTDTDFQGRALLTPRTIYANKNAVVGAFSGLIRPGQDTMPLLMLDSRDQKGVVLWPAGRAGEVYGCEFWLRVGARTLTGQFYRTTDGQRVPLGDCTLNQVS